MVLYIPTWWYKFQLKKSIDISILNERWTSIPNHLAAMNSSHSTRWFNHATEKYESKWIHLPQWLGWKSTCLKSPPGVWKANWCFSNTWCILILFHLFKFKTHMESHFERIALLNGRGAIPFVGWRTCWILGFHLRAVDYHSQFKARPCD